MWANQREFLNGVVRKLKPKKILEIGVEKGGSAIIILNAIKDIDNSKLYSIDLNSDENEVGKCVKNYFPEFMKNWELFIGNYASEFMEKIGNIYRYITFGARRNIRFFNCFTFSKKKCSSRIS